MCMWDIEEGKNESMEGVGGGGGEGVTAGHAK